MRVVLIHRYFWPDTPPYAHILREIALGLGKAGHDVTVLTCQPSYNRAFVSKAPRSERLAPGVEVRRWPVLPDRRFAGLKALNLAWFCLRLLLARRAFAEADVVMAASTPPIAVAKLAQRLASGSGAHFVYHKQDIYPEVVLAPGILRRGRRADLLRWTDSRTDRLADRIVVLSEDMADTIAARGVKRDKIVVINNFDPWANGTKAEASGKSPARWHGAPLIVAFAGNLGRFQNLEKLFDAIAQVKDDDRIVFHFFGTGALAEQIERQVRDDHLNNVHLHGYCEPEIVGDFLRTQADIGIVSLMPGVVGAAYPSKTMSYLRQGCAVLALVEAESRLAATLVSAGAGFQVEPMDTKGLVETLRRLSDHPEELVGAGGRAADLYTSEFSPTRQLSKWLGLFVEMHAGSKG